jgi:hypothetical protein
MNKPLLVCMTTVRNDAWVLNAFMAATSIWADYIVVADQMSTDNTRSILQKYPKVIVVENNTLEINEPERYKMVIDKAREIEGDKILFAFDVDEVLSANFIHTKDWERILCSKKGDVFCFQWAHIHPSGNSYSVPDVFFPWVFHDDGIEPHANYVRNLHSMRIPYPIEEKQMFYVNDFKVLHLQELIPNRQKSKLRMMIMVDYLLNDRKTVKLSRYYLPKKNRDTQYLLTSDMLYDVDNFGFNLFELVDLDLKKFWYDSFILDHLERDGNQKYCKIDIWDSNFIHTYGLKDPRSMFTKCLHLYLRLTQNFSHYYVVRAVDKLLKIIGL